jgi:hypothetical protein
VGDHSVLLCKCLAGVRDLISFVGSNPLVAAYNMIVWLPQKQSKNVPASRLASCLLWTRGGPWSL